MTLRSMVDTLLEQPLVYRLWQAPFVAGKLRPVLAGNDVRSWRRVLDVGCGPGMNTAHFQHADYVGIDINPSYVASARRRHGRTFVVADVREHAFPAEERFDAVLVNSFLHHVDGDEAARILDSVTRTLAPDGSVHVVDLVLPERPSLPRWLARHDRGLHPRSVEAWHALFGRVLDVTHFEPFVLGPAAFPVYQMVYCRGKAKR